MTGSAGPDRVERPCRYRPMRIAVTAAALVTLLVMPALVPTGSALWIGPNRSRTDSSAAMLTGPKLETSVVGPVALGNQTVSFSAGAAGLEAVYGPRISVGNGSVGAGNTSQARATFAGTTASLSVTVPGLGSETVKIPALGTRSVELAGLNYTVAGTPINVYAEVVGSVNGTTFVGANGTGGNVSFSWNSNSTLTIPFTATGKAPGTIEVGVANLTYDLRVGIVARGNVGGLPVSVPLVPSTALPAAPGAPANVAGRFAIVAPPSPTVPSNPPKAAAPGFTLSAPLAVGAIVVALIMGLALGWFFHRRSASGVVDPRRCRGCGRRFPRGASFCPSCARPVGPDPPGAAP